MTPAANTLELVYIHVFNKISIQLQNSKPCQHFLPRLALFDHLARLSFSCHTEYQNSITYMCTTSDRDPMTSCSLPRVTAYLSEVCSILPYIGRRKQVTKP